MQFNDLVIEIAHYDEITVYALDWRKDDQMREELYNGVNPYSEEGYEIFRKFLKDNKCAFYGAPNEDFFMHKAVEAAREAGVTKVIAENLS